ncbi:Unconventional prefoldin RPB5 interactor [Myotis davidii]|uniref:Unconventional prefoldin RPB5 interactor n=1 Tax=Myotis davidii TaxID=225400 RepID=L5LN80_MYODS|nr:Unconventional prefoldin RPB5 interactor [Myotis davidii]
MEAPPDPALLGPTVGPGGSAAPPGTGKGGHLLQREDPALLAGASSVPAIYFSHTVEPKRVRINTGKNTTLKFSEKKEEAKWKQENSCVATCPGAAHNQDPCGHLQGLRGPGERAYIPRKSILKSCSRENSVCSDTSEGSAADCEERRGLLRSVSILEEEQEQLPETLLPTLGRWDARSSLSGTVIEKELSPCLAPHPAAAHPVLPMIPERREVLSEGSEVTKRVSKVKAARLQQRT